MARALRRTVIVDGVSYPAGTAETAALKKSVPNAKAWDGEPDAAEPEPKKTTQPRKRTTAKVTTTEQPPADQTSGPATSEEPPRGGEGATEEAWREYATGLDIEVPEGAGRDDIIALVDARGSDK